MARATAAMSRSATRPTMGSSGGGHRGHHLAEAAGCGNIEVDRVEQSLRPLQTLLAPCPLRRVVGQMGAGRQLSHG